MSLQSGIEKYNRKTETMAQNYNAAKGRMVQNWVKGLSEKAGVTPSASRVQAYQNGVSAAQYRPGNGQKWAENWRRAMTGG